ncbi:MAG: DUF5340 domain-containing protein [Hydrococcus sp. RU_2_2]|nr:DUF5340 domain-containing protein [Hydrococcus sp. RU_2_2]NJP22517.1 DUF5340 domain-containing protein [Hydrococcus sp. CRU_1_1]NJQ96993.1 DUF5340 domain-containing protein [Hydrococcus sp. CSU_1_8]
MEPLPLPSHVHYELLLQLLERKTLSATNQNPMLREQVQQLIVTLRKALAQQKHLEATCQQTYVLFEHRWSLNNVHPEKSSDLLASQSHPSEET